MALNDESMQQINKKHGISSEFAICLNLKRHGKENPTCVYRFYKSRDYQSNNKYP